MTPEEKRMKYIFHASKVDRIAIVDRPAVPDAEILVFKRESGKEAGGEPVKPTEEGTQKSLAGEVDFERDYTISQAQAAVNVLESAYWKTAYAGLEPREKLKAWKQILKSFTAALVSVVEKIPYVKPKADGGAPEPSIESMMANFKRGLEVVAVREAFAYFKNAVWSLVMSAGVIPDSTNVAKAMVDTFAEFLETHAEVIASKQLEESTAEKIGRKISTARLRKLKEAVSTITAIINEVELVPQEKREEVSEMTPEEIQQAIEKALDPIKAVLIEKGIIEKELSEEEKKAKEEQEAKEKAEAEEKAKKDAEAQAEKEKAEKEEAEKKAKELQELKEKAEKAEKALSELTELKEKMDKINKALVAFEKRTGHKVSLDVEEGSTTKRDGDPFADALKGK